jgi:hypothetical protein
LIDSDDEEDEAGGDQGCPSAVDTASNSKDTGLETEAFSAAKGNSSSHSDDVTV